jgi:UDP-N-acetylglucosamine acyltransferase
MARIHHTALVERGAQLADDVEVGPYAVIGPHVQIDRGTTVGAHAVIEGRTTIGQNNRIFQFASLGAAPQDKKYGNEPTRLRIGNGNTIREFVTMNLGTVQDRGETTIGDDNWVMAYVHVAHDCLIGDHTIFASYVGIAGHAVIGDWVILGGYSGIHQFCKVGAHAMTAINSMVVHDIPPFVMAAGDSAKANGLNVEGLKRRGFSGDEIAAIRGAYKTIYRSGLTLEEARMRLRAEIDPAKPGAPHVEMMADFLDSTTRGIVR